MRFKLVALAALLTVSLYAQTISVAVAANVSYAIDDIKKEFKRLHPDTNLKITLGSSGKLSAQINHGAPYDIFMSANMKYPQTLYEKGLALYEPSIYAGGSLALFSIKKQDFGKGIEVLAQKSIKKIAIANPKTAPYGKAAFEALKNSAVLSKVRKKFVYAESISQTISYTIVAADIGIVAKSSLYSPKMSNYKENIHYKEIDKNLYKAIDQGIVILKMAEDKKGAKDFYDFILSKRAKEIFRSFGYITP